MGEPQSGQGSLHGGSGWETDCLCIQWTQLALCLGVVTQGHPPCATPQGGPLGHPTPERDGGNSLQANQPTGSLPTPHCQPPSHLLHRFEWAQWTCYNLPTRATGQQHKSYHRQASLPGNWYSTTSGGGPRPKDTASWQGLHHRNSQPTKVHPPKLEGEGSMTMEVRNLLSRVMLEMSGCRSENLTLRRSNQVVVPAPPPQRSEDLLQAVDTSSQVSTEVVEASLEGIPTSISPIAVASRTGSITPLVDAMELWENANKALQDLLTTIASIDAHRLRAIWELGMELHWNKSQAAKSIKEAKAICSQVILDTKTTCSVVVKEAKTTQGHIIWEAKATCSSAIRDIEARRASQAVTFQREHGNTMWDLEAQVIWEESRSQATFLSACQATLYTCPPEFKNALATSYISYWHRHLHHLHSSYCKGLPQWKSSLLQLLLPHQCPSSLLGPKDGTLPQTLWRACLWVEPLWRWLWENPPAPSGKRSHPGTEHSSWAMLRHLARTLTW